MEEADNTNWDFPPIWEGFCTALGTEYREAKEITGASGLKHPVEAIGVDDKDKRLILVSADTNPRIAALLRGDVEQSMPGFRVLVARPLALDLSHVARETFFNEAGALDISRLRRLGEFNSETDGSDVLEENLVEVFGSSVSKMWHSARRSALPVSSRVLNLFEQLQNLDWNQLRKPEGQDDAFQMAINFLTQFSQFDTLSEDREQGICPVPTYEFDDTDWDMFHANKDVGEIRHRLKEMEVYQYFYPPADKLALGLIDRNSVQPSQLDGGFELSEERGHQVSANELLPDASDLTETLRALRSEGYVADGEFTVELGERGQSVRKTLKLRPSEGAVAKLSKILSIKVDLSLKDLFGEK